MFTKNENLGLSTKRESVPTIAVTKTWLNTPATYTEPDHEQQVLLQSS